MCEWTVCACVWVNSVRHSCIVTIFLKATAEMSVTLFLLPFSFNVFCKRCKKNYMYSLRWWLHAVISTIVKDVCYCPETVVLQSQDAEKIITRQRHQDKTLTLPHSSSKVQSAMEPQVFARVTSLPSTVSVLGPVTMETYNKQYASYHKYFMITFTVESIC